MPFSYQNESNTFSLYLLRKALPYLLYQLVQILIPHIGILVVEIFTHGEDHVLSAIAGSHFSDIFKEGINLFDIMVNVILFINQTAQRRIMDGVQDGKILNLRAFVNSLQCKDITIMWNYRISLSRFL